MASILPFKYASYSMPLVDYIDDEDYKKARKARVLKKIDNIISSDVLLGLIIYYLKTHNIWILDKWPKKYQLSALEIINNPIEDLILYEVSLRFYQDIQNTYIYVYTNQPSFNWDRFLNMFVNLQRLFINIRIERYTQIQNLKKPTRYALFVAPHSLINRQSIKDFLENHPVIPYDTYFDALNTKRKKAIMQKRHDISALFSL
jgi:predicted N-acyltransferase